MKVGTPLNNRKKSFHPWVKGFRLSKNIRVMQEVLTILHGEKLSAEFSRPQAGK